jgi:hypothetical protein
MPVRDIFKLIYKVVMIIATVGLVLFAYVLYRTATPGNGQLLVSGIVAILALMAFLSINRLDWQDEQAETYRSILDDMRTRFPVSIQFGGAANPSAIGTVSFADPEVHRVDTAMVDEAKRLMSEGKPIDEICRMIDPGHDTHDPAHQEAFRRVVRAAIEQS